MFDPVKYHVIGADGAANRVMRESGFEWSGAIEDADIVVLTGGADIHPSIYGHDVHPDTSALVHRDLSELEQLHKAKVTALKVGICRGGQLLHALSGGVLWQDVSRHTGAPHSVTYHGENEDTEYVVNSLHHQMMVPFPNYGAKVWADCRLAGHRDLHTRMRVPLPENSPPDPEIIWHPMTRSLCFQAHPEYMHKSTTELFNIVLFRAIAECQAMEQ